MMDFRFSLVLAALLAIALILLLQQRCTAQMTPSAPVRNFYLPRFGEDGYKIWALSGSEGRYISPERIDVIEMTLRLFSGDARGTVETQIESPKAALFIKRNYARSEDAIIVEGKGYRIEGQDWVWDGNQKKVIVQNDVHVIFNQALPVELIK